MDMTDVRRFDQPQVGTIKLSEAIRIGMLRRPQCSRAFFANGRSCAIGAAYEGLFGTPEGFSARRLYSAFPRIPGRIWAQIITQNDGLDKSREQIADWLEAQGL